MPIIIANDGIDHVNVYSKGKTELGQFATNFSHCHIIIDEDGPFESIEGYWGWLGLSDDCPVKESLRTKYGYAAKKAKEDAFASGNYRIFDNNFEEKIRRAIFIKWNTEQGRTILRNNIDLLDLPFEHYYCFGDKIIDMKRKFQFVMDATLDAIAAVRQTL